MPLIAYPDGATTPHLGATAVLDALGLRALGVGSGAARPEPAGTGAAGVDTGGVGAAGVGAGGVRALGADVAGAGRLARRGSVEVLVGWVPQPPAWVADPTLSGFTVIGGYGLAEPLADGRLDYLPVRLSAMAHLLGHVMRPDVAVVSGVRRGTRLAFRDAVAWGPAAVAAAAHVVVEVEEGAPDVGAPLIEGRVDLVIDRPPDRSALSVGRPPTELERQIGQTVAGLLPEAATIQLGLGGVADAVLEAIERPVSIRTGLFSETAARLVGRGLLTGVAEAGYLWGGEATFDLARSGRVRLHDVGHTHDASKIAAVPNFVSCNTALQVGLDGSVNVERVGGRQLAAVGGHADFCAGASRSPGGFSLVMLASTTRSGRSTIVPTVEVVSTPRCDVDVVVTEHGVADLRGIPDVEVARRLTAIAAPQHRGTLESEGVGR